MRLAFEQTGLNLPPSFQIGDLPCGKTKGEQLVAGLNFPLINPKFWHLNYFGTNFTPTTSFFIYT